MNIQNVCVFCGSSPGARPEYIEAAQAMGRALAARDIGLVYGGGNVGLMGAVADATLEAGGRVLGVIPQSLVDWEVAHRGLTELRVVGSMHERKALMAEACDAFVALPGGFGTFEEFCEVLTWSQLGLHPQPKPCGIVNVADFYRPLLALFDHAVQERFVRPEHHSLVLVEDSPEALLEAFATFTPPTLGKWIDRDST
jgi:hypothetical protein